MNLHRTLTMPLVPISIQKIRCLIMRITWMSNHVIVPFSQTGVASPQIIQWETGRYMPIVSIKVVPCLSDRIIQQNALIIINLEDPANAKPQHRWEIQVESNRYSVSFLLGETLVLVFMFPFEKYTDIIHSMLTLNISFGQLICIF